MANDVLERMRGSRARQAERKQRAKERAAERVEQGKRNREHAARAKAEAEAQRAAAKPAPPKPAPAPVAVPRPTNALDVEPDDIAGQRMREFSQFLGRTRNAQAAQLRKGRK